MRKIIAFFILMFIFFVPCAMAEDALYAASPQGEISLHLINDEKSFVITSIPACSSLKLIETRGTWGKVIFRHKCGWINLSFTEDSYTDAASSTGYDSVKYVTVSSEKGKTALYNVPSTDEALGGKVKYTVPNGTILSITRETANGWGLAEMAQKNAWIQMKETAPYENFTEKEAAVYGIYYVYVLSSDGNGIALTETPESKEALLIIPDCVKLTVREEQKGFGYVSYGGVNGWIDLKLTADSLSNAQSNTGEAVNAEYIVTSDEKFVNMFSVPANESFDESLIVGKVKSGTTVFVLRQTALGWGLINYNGIRGWLSPEVLTEKEQTEKIEIEINDPYYIYVMTEKGKGLALYPSPDDSGKSFVSVPEAVRLKVITKYGSYCYVKNDYAAGWALIDGSAESYEEALSRRDKEVLYLRVTKETELKSIPTYSAFCGGMDLDILPFNTYLEITRTVLSGNRRWGLTSYNGKTGWVNLNCTKKTISPIAKKSIIVFAVILALAVIFIIRVRKRKKYE